ncbi:class I SAM-dependent DNA methyltransferase [Roseateles sp. DXS20W]|uniref:site-specific DNA-methyltransferase (adenine-specific) n=1 Tax=Pelomonas lactea TaxID=3299030 RepID=A0ABW7GE50_9BURK
MHDDLSRRLTAFGAAPSEIHSLKDKSAATIEFLDLQREQSGRADLPFIAPDAVVLVNGQPLLYAVNVESLPPLGDVEVGLVSLRSALACRGEKSYLAIVHPGQIELVSAHYAPDLADSLLVRAGDKRADFLIRDLAAGVPPGSIERQRWEKATRDSDKRAVHDLLFGLLDHVTQALRKTGPLQGRDGEILSLVGRVLFTCFLLDRRLLTQSTCPELFKRDMGSPFGNARTAALCCNWLDETFNGELLPLDCDDYDKYFASLNDETGSVFRELSKIIDRTTPLGQMFLDCSWIDFSHVPADLLSQVYESYAHKFFGDDADQESIHYTPRYIAEYMLDQAFPGIDTVPLDEVRVLDPAAGACIFLVLSLRRLVQERWRRTGKRPRTKEIRRILNDQLRGYDINDHALKLGALSLYLTALELDPEPMSGESMLFEPLLGTVLFNTRLEDEQRPCALVVGSLGAVLPDDPKGNQYDLVISNPPWTPWKAQKGQEGSQKRADAINKRVSLMIRKIAGERSPLLKDIADDHENPLKAPDVPFIWRSMLWAKPQAVIAYAVHARLLFRRADAGASAREALFRALRITGVLNGTALRKEEVWPDVDAPFCLLFARNEVPSAADHFYFVSPEIERGLNRRSLWRTDYESAQPIESGVLVSKPHLLKTLFRGTPLDVDLIDRLEAQLGGDRPKMVRLADYWTEERGLFSGQGFMGPGKEKAEFIADMGAKMLSTRDASGRYVETSRLKPFTLAKVERPRRPEIYRTPLVLFSQTPGAKATSHPVRITLDSTPVAFNYSFYGYSTAGHAHPAELACYLFVIANSSLFRYYTLMTSARFGVERDTIYVEDVNQFPLVPFEQLNRGQKIDACKFAEAFCKATADEDSLVERMNRWVCSVYGLSRADGQLIDDALAVSSPVAESKNLAQSKPTRQQVRRFERDLASELREYFDDDEPEPIATVLDDGSDSWMFLVVDLAGGRSFEDSGEMLRKALTALADREGASRVLMPLENGKLCIGILAQYRYWTSSRARALAMDIAGMPGSLVAGELEHSA